MPKCLPSSSSASPALFSSAEVGQNISPGTIQRRIRQSSPCPSTPACLPTRAGTILTLSSRRWRSVFSAVTEMALILFKGSCSWSSKSHIHILRGLSDHLCADHSGFPHHPVHGRGAWLRGRCCHIRQPPVWPNGLGHPNICILLNFWCCERALAHLLKTILCRCKGRPDAGCADYDISDKDHTCSQCAGHYRTQLALLDIQVTHGNTWQHMATHDYLLSAICYLLYLLSW